MIVIIKKSIIFFSILVASCTTNFFNVENNVNSANQGIPIADYKNLESTIFYSYHFYKSRDDIDKEFIEVAVLSTDMNHYGNFFYDDVFMSRLKDEIISLNANAVLYEKNKKDFTNYNEKLLYFTAIRLIEK